MDFNIKDETSKLDVVMLGIATDMGRTPVPQKCYDPKSIENVLNGTYPKEQDCIQELNLLKNIFEKYGVKVIRPKNIVGVNQIFTRDISFVIEDKLIMPNIIDDRMQEINGMNDFLFSVDKKISSMFQTTFLLKEEMSYCIMIIFLLAIQMIMILRNIKLQEPIRKV